MRIGLADDHALFRAGLRSALREAFGADTEVLEAKNLQEMVALMQREEALDLVLCDLKMLDMDPRGGVARLVALHRKAPVVVVAASEDPRDACRSIRQGARGYIPKSDSLEILYRALELVLAGGTYVPAEVMLSLQDGDAVPGDERTSGTRGLAPDDLPALSNRQMLIFERLADGKPNKLIARELGIAEGTVKAQLRTIFRKLGVQNRTQAALFAARILGRKPSTENGATDGEQTAQRAPDAGTAAEPADTASEPRVHGKFKVFDFPG